MIRLLTQLYCLFCTLLFLWVLPAEAQNLPGVPVQNVTKENSQNQKNKAGKIKRGEKNSGKVDKETKEQTPQEKFESYVTDFKRWVYTVGFHVLIIVVLAGLALKSTSSFSKRLLTLFTKNKEGTELKKRADTLTSVVRYLSITVIVGIAGMMILGELNIDIGPILAGAGVVGLAVGFGAQNLVKDVISGFFILLEDQIRVGDVVQIADKSGTVERVTLRMVVLRDLNCNVHYIPSGEITVVTNMTKKFSAYIFDIGVSYRENVSQVIEVMKEVDQDLRKDPEFESVILEPLEIFGLQRFDDSAVVVRARTKTKPVEQWRVGREFNKRLKEKFDDLGIEIPFPHLTVYAGEDKQGHSPSFNLGLDRDFADAISSTQSENKQ